MIHTVCRRKHSKVSATSDQILALLGRLSMAQPANKNYRHKQLTECLRFSRLQHIPARRLLIRPGSRIRTHLYLCSGRLQLTRAAADSHDQPTRTTLTARGRMPKAFFPGCSQARTLSPVCILQIDSTAWHNINRPACTAKVPRSSNPALSLEPTERWLQQFLQSPVMQRLSKTDWQQLLNQFELRHYTRGQAIITQGELADCCYVMTRGRAVVHRHSSPGQAIAQLHPGDFFGEDALITAQQRNACVTAAEQVQAARIDASSFNQLLLQKTASFVALPEDHPAQAKGPLDVPAARHGKQTIQNNHARLLNIAPPAQAEAINIPLHHLREQLSTLDQHTHYYITGGNRRQRTLCAFIMMQKGFNAEALA